MSTGYGPWRWYCPQDMAYLFLKMKKSIKSKGLFFVSSVAIHVLVMVLVVFVSGPKSAKTMVATAIVDELELVVERELPVPHPTVPVYSTPRLDEKLHPKRKKPEKEREPKPNVSLKMRGQELDLEPDWSIVGGETTRHAKTGESERPKQNIGSEEQQIKEKLDRMFAQDRAIRNVRTGKVHPYFHIVGRYAQNMLRPSWKMIEKDQSKVGTVVGSNTSFWVAWAKDYL
ncbi:MAG: hypothetical protein V1754_00330, partial [Pseudomonadota bacterium]